jgi:hypothetical protein
MDMFPGRKTSVSGLPSPGMTSGPPGRPEPCSDAATRRSRLLRHEQPRLVLPGSRDCRVSRYEVSGFLQTILPDNRGYRLSPRVVLISYRCYNGYHDNYSPIRSSTSNVNVKASYESLPSDIFRKIFINNGFNILDMFTKAGPTTFSEKKNEISNKGQRRVNKQKCIGLMKSDGHGDYL